MGERGLDVLALVPLDATDSAGDARPVVGRGAGARDRVVDGRVIGGLMDGFLAATLGRALGVGIKQRKRVCTSNELHEEDACRSEET